MYMYDCDGYNRTVTDVSTIGGAHRMEFLFHHSGSRCIHHTMSYALYEVDYYECMRTSEKILI